MHTHPTLWLIGAGRLGSALCHSLYTQGWSPTGIWNRSSRDFSHLPCHTSTGPHPPQALYEADVVLLTVADDAIQNTFSRHLQKWSTKAKTIFLHCSGRLSSDTLSHETHRTLSVGGFHPLQAITDIQKAQLFEDIAVGIDGEPDAFQQAQAIVELLGGEAFSLEGVDKALYHAAAVTASNYLVTLASVAQGLLKDAGLQGEGLPLLLPLMKIALHNIERRGLPEALTGPLARADNATIAAHLQALESVSPVHKDLYVKLAQHTLPLATQLQIQREGNDEGLDAIKKMLSTSEESSRKRK